MAYGVYNKLDNSALPLGNFEHMDIPFMNLEDCTTSFNAGRQNYQDMIIYVVSV